MIIVTCKEETYIYNAYNMVRAFYPEEEVNSSIDPEQEALILVNFSEGANVSVSGECLSRLETERALYAKLTKISGRTLPWGVLMGVRPTKLATSQIDKGMDLESFKEWFARERCVSDAKAELAYKVALKEQRIIRSNVGDYSLYVGIPFCPSICSYCSFSSGAINAFRDKVGAYLDALISEIKAVAKMCSSMTISTVYVGGGTPTTLSASELDQLLGVLRSLYPSLHEFTVEAGRPDTIDADKLAVLKKHGVSRISINPQSMQQKTLDLIGRKHSIESVVQAFKLARDMGFDNINMDLIAGLPGEGLAEMQDTLRQIKELSPDSLTVHSLAIKRTAKMGQEGYTASSGEIEAMIEAAALCAEAMGMEPYYLYRQKSIAGNFENVGYARPGKEGIYNVLIMEEVQSIIACGAGGSSKIVLPEPIANPNRKKGGLTKIVRTENVKNISEYIAREPEMEERKRVMLTVK